MMRIRYRLSEGGYAPERAHRTDAGWDLRIPDTFIIPPKGCITVDTLVGIEVPEGYVGMLKSKSGLNVKFGLRGEGVIDAGYTGNIVVKMYNDSDTEHVFEKGDKLIQIVFLPILNIDEMIEVDSFDKTDRGDSGFGSTGR